MTSIWLCCVVGLSLSLLVLSVSTDPDESPNIIIFFADNLGYSDIDVSLSSDRGAPSRTPNLRRLRREGLFFENWNSAAHLCSASRATLLTGQYHVRTGIYPGVFQPDALHGLPPSTPTIASFLCDKNYTTRIVGKWHLGHREPFLPTKFGFEGWLGIPYHMSGGSVDNHTCHYDANHDYYLPLFEDDTIIQQPVNVHELAARYAQDAVSFIESATKLFFLYLPFSHMHQLCAPQDYDEQATCQWASDAMTFDGAVEEMDWIVGQVMNAVDKSGHGSNTLTLFTSDNGPWVAEQTCSGKKGPFVAEWFQRNCDASCVSCPHDFIPSPLEGEPHRCILPNTTFSLTGVPCGEDTGLGSLWEANLRMPAIARWPGRVKPSSTTAALVSTLDVFPTIAGILGDSAPPGMDGLDISSIMFGKDWSCDRMLFFWRDGFVTEDLPAPYGRMDVAAVKFDRHKFWFWTKSAHYNSDVEVYHDPPLIFDTLSDPAESKPLDPSLFTITIVAVKEAVEQHKRTVDLTSPGPLTLAKDTSVIPCVDRGTKCRTDRGSGPHDVSMPR